LEELVVRRELADNYCHHCPGARGRVLERVKGVLGVVFCVCVLENFTPNITPPHLLHTLRPTPQPRHLRQAGRRVRLGARHIGGARQRPARAPVQPRPARARRDARRPVERVAARDGRGFWALFGGVVGCVCSNCNAGGANLRPMPPSRTTRRPQDSAAAITRPCTSIDPAPNNPHQTYNSKTHAALCRQDARVGAHVLGQEDPRVDAVGGRGPGHRHLPQRQVA
jgi:hypothetical protein